MGLECGVSGRWFRVWSVEFGRVRVFGIGTTSASEREVLQTGVYGGGGLGLMDVWGLGSVVAGGLVHTWVGNSMGLGQSVMGFRWEGPGWLRATGKGPDPKLEALFSPQPRNSKHWTLKRCSDGDGRAEQKRTPLDKATTNEHEEVDSIPETKQQPSSPHALCLPSAAAST
eukprot:1947217-Rhodomonas_salina.2